MASLMLMHTLIQTLVQLKHFGHVHQRSVGDAEASEGSRDSDPAKVEPIGPHVFLWAGLDQGSLRNHFGDVRDRNLKENKRFYGFTDFRGKPAGRGRGSRGSKVKLPPGAVKCV